MSEVLQDDIPESSIIATYEGDKYQSHLMNSVDFVRIYVSPSRRRAEPFYRNLKYFSGAMGIPKTNEVIFQTDGDGHIVSFGVFGQRWDYDKFFRIFAISTHPDHKKQGRAREILRCIALRTAEHGFTEILPSNIRPQPFGIEKWQKCIYRILEGAGIKTIQ